MWLFRDGIHLEKTLLFGNGYGSAVMGIGIMYLVWLFSDEFGCFWISVANLGMLIWDE
jgi:hypothetical protein